MAGRNWDRVRREKPLIGSYDYSAALDAREQGVVFGAEQDEAYMRLVARRERRGLPTPPDRGEVKDRSGTKQASSGRKGPKSSRDALAKRVAGHMGITVERLKELRRQQQNLDAMTAEAEDRGITVKELRQMLSGAVVANEPDAAAVGQSPPQPSKPAAPRPALPPGAPLRRAAGASRAPIVSRTKRERHSR